MPGSSAFAGQIAPGFPRGVPEELQLQCELNKIEAVDSQRPEDMRLRGSILFMILLIQSGLASLSGSAARDQDGDPFDPLRAGFHAFRIFRDAEGIPQNTIHSITIDHKGFIWIGTQDGAAFYNGRSWTVVNMPQRFRSNFVRAILPLEDGSLWFGTQADGVQCLEDGQWKKDLAYPAGTEYQRVNAMLVQKDPGGKPVIWIGTHQGGLLRYYQSQWTIYGVARGLPDNRVWAIQEGYDEEGVKTVWVGTEKGLARMNTGASRFVVQPGYPQTSCNCILETAGDGEGRALWVSTYGDGVHRLYQRKWEAFRAKEGLQNLYVTSLAFSTMEEKIRTLWIGTDGGGLFQLREGSMEQVDVGSGLPSNAVYSLLATQWEDGTNALWIGTRNGGLACLHEGQWRHFRPTPKASQLPVNAILETQPSAGRQTIWFGLDGGGLARLENLAWTFFTTGNSGLPNDIVQCLETTGEGGSTVWVGTRNGGLAAIRDGRWRVFNHAGGDLPNDMVQTLLTEKTSGGSSILWIGTRGGLARYANGNCTAMDSVFRSLGSSVTALLLTPGQSGDSLLWVGTSGGLVCREKGQWKQFDFEPRLLNTSIQSLHRSMDQSGTPLLWVGTDGGGLVCIDLKTRRTRFVLNDDSRPPLPNSVIYQMLEDLSGRLYVLTNKGVVRLTPNKSGSETNEYQVYTFTVSNGLPLNQGVRGSGMRDSRGRIWIGTVGGAAVYDPAREMLDRAPKKLFLSGMVIADQHNPLLPNNALPYDKNHLVFEFALLSYFREQDTRYRTQMVGLDSLPSEWGTDYKKEYPTLQHGTYEFRVWGKDYAGNVSGPITFTFSIAPAPWETIWAYLIISLVIALTVFGIMQFRLRAHRHREVELLTLVDARTRELKEANQILVELSYLDPLTGVANRRRFDERLALEWKRSIRSRAPISLIMVDIDKFKSFNDYYGHQTGDDCLKSVAATLSDGLSRTGDSVARYGGEEFGVILPQTDLPGAMKVAERLRERVEALGIMNAASRIGRFVTISCGVATVIPTLEDMEDSLIRLSDEALYRGKRQGGNVVAI